jgi:hypothetical protein
MTRATGHRAPPDPSGGAQLLEQSRRTLASAQADGVDADSGYLLAYQAALKAALAILRAGGRRVSAGSGGHVVILEEAAQLLPSASDQLRRIDRMRRARNQLAYEGEEVGERDRDAAVADAATLIGLVSDHLGERA